LLNELALVAVDVDVEVAELPELGALGVARVEKLFHISQLVLI
jgi:hypothetical protein